MKLLSLVFIGLFTLAGCTEGPDPLIINIGPQGKKDANLNGDTMAPDLGGVDLSSPEDMGEDQSEDVVEPEPLEDIAVELAKLPNVDNVEELRMSQGQRRFYIDFRQPLDHFANSSAAFTQRAILYFRSYDAPTVLMTTGYGLPDVQSLEGLPVGATEILEANQLVLGHRFFTGAVPSFESQNWAHVNIRQSAEDTHEILTSMRSILRQNWVGTGWSKGGMTIIFQEYFYPDDLELAVPMVAPISFSRHDDRYPPFVAAIGTEECRATLEESMLGALSRKLELADVFGPQDDFERQQYADNVKYSVIAFPWSFWQYYGISFCQFIPSGSASANDLVSFYIYNQLPKVTPPRNEARPIEEEEAELVAYTYQGLSQLGFQDFYPTGHLQLMVDYGHLSAYEKAQLENSSYEYGDYPWSPTIPTYDPQPMIDIDTWLRTDAEDIVAIYGQYDPWTGGKITLNGAKNSEVYIAPGGSHSTFISDLEGPDYTAVRNRLLSYDNRDRVRSEQKVVKKATEAEREILRKLLRQEL